VSGTSISAALRQDTHINVAAVAGRWQRVGDLIGSGFKLRTSSIRSRRQKPLWNDVRLIYL